MRKSTFLFSFLAFLFFSLNLEAQRCGISAEQAKELSGYTLQLREEMRDFVFDRGAVTYVPVRFFLVAKSDGTGRPSERLALQSLCQLNEAYEPHEIQFYLKEFKYLNSTALATNPESFAGGAALENAMAGSYNAINVFIVDQIADPGVAAYWQGPPQVNDWIVMSDGFATTDNVLAHEVGHFFSLLHTFNGWEGTNWDPGIHGAPLQINSIGGVQVEYVNGSNCEVAGDFMCDTPADYNFGPSNSCEEYAGGAQDPSGALLDPDESNRMNYFYNCSDYHFSDDQVDQINLSLFSSSRNYVRPGITPTLDQVAGVPTPLSPASGETIDSYNFVVLEWTEVTGANKYYVEVTNTAIGSLRFIVNDNKLVLTTLAENQTYIWRIMAFNEYSTCAGLTSIRTFKTGNIFSDTSQVPESDRWTVTPNPVKGGQPITLNVESANGLKADVSIITMTGQIVRTFADQTFSGAFSTLDLPTDGMPSGIYLVALRTSEGIETQRVAIVD